MHAMVPKYIFGSIWCTFRETHNFVQLIERCHKFVTEESNGRADGDAVALRANQAYPQDFGKAVAFVVCSLRHIGQPQTAQELLCFRSPRLHEFSAAESADPRHAPSSSCNGLNSHSIPQKQFQCHKQTTQQQQQHKSSPSYSSMQIISQEEWTASRSLMNLRAKVKPQCFSNSNSNGSSSNSNSNSNTRALQPLRFSFFVPLLPRG